MKKTMPPIRPMTEAELVQVAQEAEDAYEVMEARRARYERARSVVESSTNASQKAQREPLAEWAEQRYEQAKGEALVADADLEYAAMGVPKARRAVRWARMIRSARIAAREQCELESTRRVEAMPNKARNRETQ